MPGYKPHVRSWRVRLGLLLLLGIVALNAVAAMQARAMTHFVAAGERTPLPETLSATDKAWIALAGVTIPKPHNRSTPRDAGLDYETHYIALGEAEQLEAWFVPGDGRRGIVLLFHAYAVSKETLLAPAVAFHKLGYAALLVDFRGYGGSSGDDTTLGLREGEDVAAAVVYAQQRWPERPLILYGMSMGSVAILRAIAHWEVQPAAIILESPFDRLLSTVRQRFYALGWPAFPGAELVVFWGGAQQGFNGFAHDPVEDAAAATCPALLMHGARDPRVTVAQTAAIFDQLRGPKQLAEFPAAGHELLITDAADLWNQQVIAFLHTIEPHL